MASLSPGNLCMACLGKPPLPVLFLLLGEAQSPESRGQCWGHIRRTGRTPGLAPAARGTPQKSLIQAGGSLGALELREAQLPPSTWHSPGCWDRLLPSQRDLGVLAYVEGGKVSSASGSPDRHTREGGVWREPALPSSVTLRGPCPALRGP